MKKSALLFLLLLCFHLANSQNWTNLSSGINYSGVYSMYADSADSYLYLCGSFVEAGGMPITGIARWDGTAFSPMGFTGSVRSMTRYHDTLYASGIFNSTGQFFVAKWNGISWDTTGRLHGYGAIFSFTEFNSELYAVGVFDSIAHVKANNIAKWNGTSWSSLKDTTFNGQIYSAAVFNNELYIGGNFYNAANGTWRIMKWNGNNYVPLSSGGVYGGMDDIVDMAVYHNELFVSGTFSKADGNVGNYIQKWNGTSWTEVGGGVNGLFGGNGQIHDMKVYGDELYVVGVFSTAGGIPAQYIAKWDGTNWCGFGSLFDNVLGAIEFKNGDIYVGGGFHMIDNDSISQVAKWIGGTYVDSCGHLSVGINEQANINQNFDLYPNPTQSTLTLQFSEATKETTNIEIKNMLGQTMKALQLQPNSLQQEIDVSSLSNGLYFMQCQNKGILISKKFVKY